MLIDQLEKIVGRAGIRAQALGDDLSGWEEDQRRRLRGKDRGRALLVVLPNSTEQVAQVVRTCVAAKVPMVPQGGNTGLVLGGTPTAMGNEVVVSLTKMNRRRNINVANNTLTVEAGCVLAAVQALAAEAERHFPLSMASEGSCTIGGNLATNAGGTAVLAFGNARDLCLGLEVVTPQGHIISNLQGLRKDNTGYDLRQLLIGAEGTLGIITAATLKLFPRPKATQTAWLTLPDLHHVLALFQDAKAHFASGLVGFELMNASALLLVQQHFPAMQFPMPTAAWQVLMETHDHESVAHAEATMQSWLEAALIAESVNDGVMAANTAQAKNLWHLRESIPLAQAREGLNIKHDIALPIDRIVEFVHQCEAALLAYHPDLRVVNFGHVGDGNLHFNIQAPLQVDVDQFLQEHEKPINAIVYQQVQTYGGSISAEHGIGRLKTDWLARTKSPAALEMMRHIKHALDPENLMNPDRIFNG